MPMRKNEEIKELVQSIIHLHETKNFEDLSAHIAGTAKEEGSWFSEKRFHEVCEAI